MSNVITLYDIPGTAAVDVAWSPNVWRARYVLHIKGLAYKTVWVEYPDIEPTLKKIGAPPTSMREGAPLYTLPVIHDPATGRIVTDSLQIALYLDAQYPSTPQLLPPASRALQIALLETFVTPRVRPPTLKLVIYATASQLNSQSEAFYHRTRAERVPGYSGTLENVARDPEVRQALLKELAAAIGELGRWKGDYPFLGGLNVSYVDAVIAAMLKWFRTVGDRTEWETVRGEIANEWDGLLQTFAKWDAIP
ncbi:hypothetical protein BV25DRAFT_1830060 [Artomyces pyxidatus]|uniref:Uncharacterized protein n=1 Tax=Artomyces pyxidatus TaxID=48021 RepID=A0ACB8SQC3_9AGAM|nr:hypothetical protein BV25DRAFT_1830060 [Artomyces pyxidatus]